MLRRRRPDPAAGTTAFWDRWAELQDLDDHVSRVVDGSGALLGRTTTGGVRTLHVYVDSTTPAADQLRAVLGGWPHGRVAVRAEHDPGWKAVAHLR